MAEQIDPSKIDFIKVMPDNSCITTVPYIQIVLPQKYFDNNICEFVGKNVNTFGLFEVRVFRTEDYETETPEKYFFKFKGMFMCTPSSVTEEKVKIESLSEGDTIETNVILEFTEGATFITSTVIQSDVNVARRMLDFMTLGYLPNILDYKEIAKYWADVNVSNGIKLGEMSQTSIELIVSELCRDPKDYSRSFRKRIKSDPKVDTKSWKLLSTKMIPRYTSVFASLTSGDPKGNLVSMISKERSGKKQYATPLEDNLN